MPDIHVSAAVIVDDEDRVLVVRKKGTTRFMQPGGKPEPGENPAQTLVRELHEELGVRLDESDLEPLGTFIAEAANEIGHRVVAEAFAVSVDPASVEVRAELAELRWISRTDADTLPLAPLSTQHLLPIAWAR